MLHARQLHVLKLYVRSVPKALYCFFFLLLSIIHVCNNSWPHYPQYIHILQLTMAASKTSPAAKHASDPANPAPSSSPKVQNATADSSSLVLQVVQKRIRYVRKRLRTISEIEAKRDSGKALNADQVCAQGHICTLLLRPSSKLHPFW